MIAMAKNVRVVVSPSVVFQRPSEARAARAPPVRTALSSRATDRTRSPPAIIRGSRAGDTYQTFCTPAKLSVSGIVRALPIMPAAIPKKIRLVQQSALRIRI